MAGYTDPDPWAPAPISLWRSNDLDPRKFAQREALCQEDAKEQKISEAIQFGRIQGLGSEHYTELRRKKLEAVLNRRAAGSKVW